MAGPPGACDGGSWKKIFFLHVPEGQVRRGEEMRGHVHYSPQVHHDRMHVGRAEERTFGKLRANDMHARYGSHCMSRAEGGNC